MKTVKKGFIALGLGVAMLTSCQNASNTEVTVNLEDEEQKLSYALGVAAGSFYKQQDLTNISPEVVAKGLGDAINSKELLLSDQESNQFIQEYVQNQQKKLAEKALEEGSKFLAENGKKSGIITTESGLQYEVLKEGTGEKPTLESKVKVHYHGTLIDGTVFDSSVDRGEPASFRVNGVIQGWQEAIPLMSVGAKHKLYIPSNLAYGDRQMRGSAIKPNSVLIFEVELLGIEE